MNGSEEGDPKWGSCTAPIAMEFGRGARREPEEEGLRVQGGW